MSSAEPPAPESADAAEQSGDLVVVDPVLFRDSLAGELFAEPSPVERPAVVTDFPPPAPKRRVTGGYARAVRSAAGAGETVFDESIDAEVSVDENQLAPWARHDAIVFITATGDSMLPGIRDRDLLAVDSTRVEPLDGQVFVAQTDEGLVVKRMRRIRRRWHLVSDNPAYEPRPVTKGDRIVGQVAWSGQPGDGGEP